MESAKKTQKEDKEIINPEVQDQKENKSSEEPKEKETKEVAEEETDHKANDKKTIHRHKKEDHQKELEKQLEDLKKEIEEQKDKYLRLSAEFDNYRKRTLREKTDLIKTAGESTLTSILPVIDDFERARKSMQGDAVGLDAVRDGVDLIYNKFCDFLKQNGVSEIAAADQDFNTDIHEALTKIPAPTEEQKGKVIDVIQKGYLLNEKVIRFAKVVVGE